MSRDRVYLEKRLHTIVTDQNQPLTNTQANALAHPITFTKVKPITGFRI